MGSFAGSFAGSFTGNSLGTAQGAASGGITAGSESSTLQAGSLLGGQEMELSEEDISLFGDTYDLSQVISLIEQEPSDSSQAEELLEQIEDSRETVTQQYEELVRNQRATELEIQYTYDSSVIAGKLSEITYEQEVNEWEETLAEAKSGKEELEEGRDFLESLEQGTVAADRSGTVAALSFEAGDETYGGTVLVSYYNTDTVQVVLEVSQYDISKISVGDTVPSVELYRKNLWRPKARHPEPQ